MRRNPRFLFFFFLLLSAMPIWASAGPDVVMLCTTSRPANTIKMTELIINQGNLPAATTTNLSRVTVCGINILRYNAVLQVQKKVNLPPAVPANLAGPAVASSPAMLAVAAPLITVSGTAKPAADKTGRESFQEGFRIHAYMQSVTERQKKANELADNFAQSQINIASRLDCYVALATKYSSVLLSLEEQDGLKTKLSTNFCPGLTNPGLWDDAHTEGLTTEINATLQVGADLVVAQASPEYSQWLGSNGADATARKALFDGLIATNKATLAAETTLLNPTLIETYNTSVRKAADWDQRAADTLEATAPWNQTQDIHCGIEYFNSNDGHIITLTATDFAQPTPTSSTVFTFTNACLPSLTVSTGLAFSAVRNSTFAFEPGPGTATNATTTQVIGYATDNRITPLFVGQLNYAYLPRERAVQLHVSGGAGVGTSSGGTSGDFFLGNAFSFAHRAVFITPAFQLTSRTRLRDGYKIGDPMGALSSVPTISGWQSGFMVTVTFAVLH